MIKSKAALLGVKQAVLSPESDLWRHAAVRPSTDHEAPLAEHQVPSSTSRDFSPVPVRASGSDGGHAEVPCPLTPRRCPFGGACHSCPVHVQAKLKVSQPDDEYELEADRVADAVMRMPGPKEDEWKECGVPGCMQTVQRYATGKEIPDEVPPIVEEALPSSGQPLDSVTRAIMEPRFGHDFSQVRVHTDARVAELARAVDALAYTVGRDVVFETRQYAPDTTEGKRLIVHEMVHVMQQAGGNASPAIQRRAAPYIKKVTVHLTPPQSADLEWQGAPPADAVGSDHFTVSTGKGYSDPDDPPGACTRTCCSDPMKQCAPPWNQPGRVGACCTYYGSNFWTGAPLVEHNGWKWWTPIQPYYSQRGIALHQHDEVTGQPIGHGCVRMGEANAKRIYDYSNGRRTNVTMDGRAAPVACDPARRCPGAEDKRGMEEAAPAHVTLAAETQAAIPGLEGVLT